MTSVPNRRIPSPIPHLSLRHKSTLTLKNKFRTQQANKTDDMDESKDASAQKLRDFNIQLQRTAFFQGRELNTIMKGIDPTAEDVIIGQSHKASGIILYQDAHVLLVTFKGEACVPGGKAQGTEHPLETAIREVVEETLGVIDETSLRALHKEPQYSQMIGTGRYTAFLVPLEKVTQHTPDKLIKLFEAKKRTMSKEEELKQSTRGNLPGRMLWHDISDFVGQRLNAFTKDILFDEGISKFIAKSRKSRKSDDKGDKKGA